MRKGREIGLNLRAMQRAFPHQHLFVQLYADGSGGLYRGTMRRHVLVMEWSDGDEANQILTAELRKLYLTSADTPPANGQ